MGDEVPMEGDPNGDFAMYLYEQPDADDEDYVRCIRYVNRDEMQDDADRLLKGGRYKRIWLGRWVYSAGEDGEEIADMIAEGE